MAYNKHNTNSITALMDNLSHVDIETPERPPPGGPFDPNEESNCTCIVTTIISGFLTCTRCPNPRPNDPFSNLRLQPIKTFKFVGEFLQHTECGNGNVDVPKPGDTYTIVVTDGGSEEDCNWAITTLSQHNKGDCDCCGGIWMNTETVTIDSIVVGECTPYGQQSPDRRWDWDGQGAELLFNSLMRELKSRMIDKYELECCGEAGTTRAGPPPNNVIDSLPIDDMAKSFQLAWNGQNSEIRGHKITALVKQNHLTEGTPTVVDTSTRKKAYHGKFIMKDATGNFIVYHVGDTVTHRGKTYRVIKKTAGTHPKSDNASFDLVGSVNKNVNGGLF